MVALGELLGEVGKEDIFVFHLEKRSVGRRRRSRLRSTYNDIGLDFGSDDRVLVNLISS